jgi:hypothetical protein
MSTQVFTFASVHSGGTACTSPNPKHTCSNCSATPRVATLRTAVGRTLCKKCGGYITSVPGPTVAAAPAPTPELKTAGEWKDEFGRLLQGYGSVVIEDAPPSGYPIVPPRDVQMPADYKPYGKPADSFTMAIAAAKAAK